MALVNFLRLFPQFRRLENEARNLRQTLDAERERFRTELARKSNPAERCLLFPPGHFYSPLPSGDEIAEAFARGFSGPPFGEIELNEEKQHALMEAFASYYNDNPFPEHPINEKRFYLANESYGHFDAIMLYCMLRHNRPSRIIEIGSGFSSAAMLDLNDVVLEGKAQFTFIDPDMSRLTPLLRASDADRVKLIQRRVQEVPLETFAALEENDVLFVDSSHVSKIGSDVNRIFFDILPILNKGVLIHIHDIAGNLEYPREWLDAGRAWNEQYLLRAFLMNNSHYRIELFTSWLFNTRHAWLVQKMPLCARGGGGQIWLRKASRPDQT